MCGRLAVDRDVSAVRAAPLPPPPIKHFPTWQVVDELAVDKDIDAMSHNLGHLVTHLLLLGRLDVRHLGAAAGWGNREQGGGIGGRVGNSGARWGIGWLAGECPDSLGAQAC